MANVFLAQDLKYERAVALKVLRPELAASLGAARFLQEIQIAARLHHPHILPLYDSDEADGLLYYVMPYLEAESLRERLARERQLPVGEALQIAREVADALSYAHSCGVVHRDIKPANILQDAGHAVVADFGIARAIGVARAQSLTGPRVIGTLAYMSPEQAEGSEYLDGRSDVYSLGCVLFEMLVGQPPFAGNTLEAVIANRLSSPIGSLRAVRELVPEAVDAAVKKALATLPADRFMSAARFAEALGTPVTVAIAVGTAQAMLHDITVARSVAVLPFENMSADPENEYFSDGVTDDIISTLSKIAALKVVCRTSTMQYKKTGKRIAAIAEELGVATILEGSVRRAAGADRCAPGRSTDREATLGRDVRPPAARRFRGAERVGAPDCGRAGHGPVPGGEAAARKEADRPSRGVQPVSPWPLSRQQVVRSGGTESDRSFRGGHRQGSRLRAGLRWSGRRPRASQHRAQLQARDGVPSAGKGYGVEGPGTGRQPRRSAHVAGLRPLARRFGLAGGGAGVQARAGAQRELRDRPPVVRRVSSRARTARRSSGRDQARPAARPPLGSGESCGRVGALLRSPLRRGDRGVPEDLGDGPRLPELLDRLVVA